MRDSARWRRRSGARSTKRRLNTILSGSECALIGLLENILAPLWVFARFGDVPSAWTVAGGALLLATLVGHEVAAREPVRVSQPGARGYRTVNNL